MFRANEELRTNIKRMLKKHKNKTTGLKICDECKHRWEGYTNSKCPNCGYHPNHRNKQNA